MLRPLNIWLLALLLPLAACSNAPWAKDLERSVAPDPQLVTPELPQPELPQPPDAPASPLAAGASGTTGEGDRALSNSGDGSARDRAPQVGDPEFIGPVRPGSTAEPSIDQSEAVDGFTDLAEAPVELRPYLNDLVQLGVLKIRVTAQKPEPQPEPKSTSSPPVQPSSNPVEQTALTRFKPQQIVTRREYARWLFATNNRIFNDQPTRQVRLATTSDLPAFQDVAKTDPDFAPIQGLANAGLIPSAIAGNSTTVTFRPDASLTREDLILWKVPVDMRRSLPAATLEAVEQTWGFQDTAKIEPRALRAVLADYQNSDFANIRRAFGYTTLFNPKKTVTRAEAAAVLWYFGYQGEGISAKQVLQPASSPVASPNPASTPEVEKEVENR